MKTPAKKKTAGPKKEPTPKNLEAAAYDRWLERAAPPGDGLEDWVEVENRWRDNIVPENND